jgi:hypothetical protein
MAHTFSSYSDEEKDFVKISSTLGICRQGDVWRVVEIVTKAGHYIQHDGAYETQESAIQAASRVL